MRFYRGGLLQMKLSEQKMKYYQSYIKETYGEIPVRVIAEDLGISKYHVTQLAHQMGLKITPEQFSELSYYTRGAENPNPITYTTCMLVCKYHYQGDSISKIAYFLMRPASVIRRILDESMRSGYYYQINNIKEAAKQ